MRQILISLFLVCLAVSSSAQKISKEAPLPLPFHFESDGHACSGYFKLTQTTMVWKSSFSTCRASWTGQKQGDGWVITLGRDAVQSKSCTYKVIEVHHRAGMDPKLGIWDVTGYTKANPHLPDDLVIDCPWMQTP